MGGGIHPSGWGPPLLEITKLQLVNIRGICCVDPRIPATSCILNLSTEQVDPRVPGDYQVAECSHRPSFQIHRSKFDKIRQRRCQTDERYQRVRNLTLQI